MKGTHEGSFIESTAHVHRISLKQNTEAFCMSHSMGLGSGCHNLLKNLSLSINGVILQIIPSVEMPAHFVQCLIKSGLAAPDFGSTASRDRNEACCSLTQTIRNTVTLHNY